jgi:hypothetical protein
LSAFFSPILVSFKADLAETTDLFYPDIYTNLMLKVRSMATSAIQGSASPAAPAPKPISTSEIQRANAAKANEQVRQPESVQQPAKAAAPPPKAENVNNQQKPPPPPPPVVNTRGEVTGGTINITA